jgi:hypothetical protein
MDIYVGQALVSILFTVYGLSLRFRQGRGSRRRLDDQSVRSKYARLE